MVNAIRGSTSSIRSDSLQPAFDPTRAFFEGLMQAQCAQLEVLTSWQQSLVAINQELWDEWVCHWAGGVPIDG